MRKTILALVASACTLGIALPAFAAPPPPDHHRHQVCHKVREHHHWVTRCHR